MWPVLAVFGRSAAPQGQPGRTVEDRLADQETVRRLASGDKEALTELYDRHARPVYSLVVRIVQDRLDAEDVVQEVFAQAWRQASRFDAGRGSVAAWLLNIARSRAIDRLRTQRARPDSPALASSRPVADLPDAAVTQESIVISSEQIQRLHDAMRTLPFLQRVAVELAYYEGLTQQEIAERLEQPLGTVKTRIRLALIKLRDAMAEVH